MNDRFDDQHQTEVLPGSQPRHRARRLTIAGLVCLGLATGTIVAANAATTSGGSNSGSGSSGSSPAPAAPRAGGPAMNSYGIDGFVTSASSSSLTVRDLFGNAKTYALDSSTTYRSGPTTKAGASSLTEGQHVSVRATKSSGTLTAVDVDIHGAHLDGSVTSVSGGVITVQDNDGFTRQIDVSSGTDYTKDGSSSSLSSVSQGVVVHAEGRVDSDGTSLDATTVDVLTKAPAGPAAGGPAGGPAAGGPGAGAPGGKGAASAPTGGASGKSGKGGSGAPVAPGNGSAPSGAPSGAGSDAPTPPSGVPSGAASGSAGNGS